MKNHYWKDAAMRRAEGITDVWDVIKAYCGRSAEVVLSICMFISIIGVLPGVHYYDFVGNMILSVQIIMLDMGGFALNTMAEHARDNGQEDAACKAERMGSFLIYLVIGTLALITIGQLAPIFGPHALLVQSVVSYAETALILVRVISTVQYIHVIHSLRGSVTPPMPPHEQIDRLSSLEKTLSHLQETVSHAPDVEAIIHSLKTEFQQSLQTLSYDTAATMKTLIDDKIAAVASPLARASEVASIPEEEKEDDASEMPVTFQESDKKGEKPPLTPDLIEEYVMAHPGATQREIADFFGVSLRTIQRKMSPGETQETPRRTLKIVK